MKSWFMEVAGDDARLELRDAPTPEPGPNQLLVKMHAASLNRGEFILGHGLHKAGAAKAIGMEGAGEVV
jgi:NADPH:quinone reductase